MPIADCRLPIADCRLPIADAWGNVASLCERRCQAAELIGCNRVELFNHFRDYRVSFIQVSVADLEEELADKRI